MEVATRNGLIAVGITIAVVGGGYLIYQKFFNKPDGNEDFQDNFAQLQVNVGKKPNNDGVVIVHFDNNKFHAYFYDNNRVIIYNWDNTKVFMRGIYSDGGKTISIDSSYGGKQVSDSSVYTNLNSLLKK